MPILPLCTTPRTVSIRIHPSQAPIWPRFRRKYAETLPCRAYTQPRSGVLGWAPTRWVSVGDWSGGIPAVLAALDGGQCTTVWDGNEPTVLCCENPNFVIDGSGNCACPDGGTDPSCDGEDSDPPPPPDPPGGGGDGGSGGDGGHGIDCGDERTDIIAECLQFGAPNPPSCGDFATGGSSLFFSWSEMNGGSPPGTLISRGGSFEASYGMVWMRRDLHTGVL